MSRFWGAVQVSLNDFRTWREQATNHEDQQTEPILIVWSYVREKHGIDPRLVDNMLDGIEMDIKGKRYDTFDDLLLYCHRVASSAAFLSLSIFGIKPSLQDNAKGLIENLALALQITDILCDIEEDLGKGRIYLPKDVLSEFGMTYGDIEKRVYDERFKQMMRHLSGITRRYFAEGWPVIGYFPATGRIAAGFGSTVFLAALNKIEQSDYDVYTRPIRFTTAQKLGLLVMYLLEYAGVVKQSW